MSNTFVKTVQQFYKENGRVLPWRHTQDPYKIWISEVMLQQTQVERVIPKYEAFIQRYPTVQALAEARVQDVFALWVGLGYNRRAQYLHSAANLIVSQGGMFPQDARSLEMLPGIGPYTARAICTFAYEKYEVFIETNIRTVFIHHFFTHKERVTDKEILTLIHATLPITHIREWYWALMDYGSYLKKTVGNASRKSQHHTTQKKFKGSVREARGAIVRILSSGPVTHVELVSRLQRLGVDSARADTALRNLEHDKVVRCARECILVG